MRRALREHLGLALTLLFLVLVVVRLMAVARGSVQTGAALLSATTTLQVGLSVLWVLLPALATILGLALWAYVLDGRGLARFWALLAWLCILVVAFNVWPVMVSGALVLGVVTLSPPLPRRKREPPQWLSRLTERHLSPRLKLADDTVARIASEIAAETRDQSPDAIEPLVKKAVRSEADRLRGRLATAVLAVPIAALSLQALVTDATWLPLERITGRDGSDHVGFLLETDGEWVTLLEEDDRRVVRLPAATVAARELCSLHPDIEPWGWSPPATWIWPRDDPDYPACHREEGTADGSS